MHTCGPVFHIPDLLKELPGLVGFETAFVAGQSATTKNIAELKTLLNKNVVMSTFGLPHGEPVCDEENLTRDWFESVSEGGGYMMHAYGTCEYGKYLFEKLELE